MVIPDDQTDVREYRLSSMKLRTAVTSAAVAVLLPLTLAAAFATRNKPLAETDLARANALLVEEMTEIRHEMRKLESSLIQLSSKDERYRILANLEPLDEEVKLAGVGGPGSRTLQASRLWQVDRSLAELTFGTSAELDALTRRAELLAASWGEATGAMESQVDLWQRTPSIYPAKGYMSSGFNPRRLHPILRVHRPHNGIDIAARRGTPVVATAKGTVRYAGDTGGAYGWMVDIDHGNGVMTRYAHLARNSIRVRTGQTVERWDHIAEVGATGLVTGPSVHYEVVVDGRPRNPEQYVLSDVLRF
jgi:murein DD-endopeptidase MepM/ murein hydrolase activator NlpD